MNPTPVQFQELGRFFFWDWDSTLNGRQVVNCHAFVSPLRRQIGKQRLLEHFHIWIILFAPTGRR
jgi:hypothetical protein